jgi:FecR protein
MKNERFAKGLIAATLLLSPALASAEDSGSSGVGVYTAVMGKVTVTHPGEAHVLPVRLHDEVLFKDVIQTDKESRTKAFFQDDSILTVGENSRVEITEYIYNPESNLRRSVVKVMQGQVRALVSKVFKSNGSRFEVHTPSAVAAARGTYFTVWHENGESGIINVGETGRVDFTSGGVTVAVDPGQFSVAEHGKAPTLPAVHGLGLNESGQTEQAQVTKKDGNGATLVDRQGEQKGNSHVASLNEDSSSKGLARAIQAVENTTVREARPAESPMHAAEAMHHDVHLANALATLNGLSDTRSGNPQGNQNGMAYATNAGQGSSNGSVNGHSGGKGNDNAYGLTGGNGIGNAFGLSAIGAVVTPPAVLTGAGNGVGNGNGGGPGPGNGNGNGNGNGYGHLK